MSHGALDRRPHDTQTQWLSCCPASHLSPCLTALLLTPAACGCCAQQPPSLQRLVCDDASRPRSEVMAGPLRLGSAEVKWALFRLASHGPVCLIPASSHPQVTCCPTLAATRHVSGALELPIQPVFGSAPEPGCQAVRLSGSHQWHHAARPPKNMRDIVIVFDALSDFSSDMRKAKSRAWHIHIPQRAE